MVSGTTREKVSDVYCWSQPNFKRVGHLHVAHFLLACLSYAFKKSDCLLRPISVAADVTSVSCMTMIGETID